MGNDPDSPYVNLRPIAVGILQVVTDERRPSQTFLLFVTILLRVIFGNSNYLGFDYLRSTVVYYRFCTLQF